MKKANKNSNKVANQLRVIGGKWRGRKINFNDAPDLRPTPNRARETVFNWLQTEIAQYSCLDLFAGSGALGIEALSRGATDVHFIDSCKSCCQMIKANLQLFAAENSSVIHASALEWLKKQNNLPYSLIFVDPPYHSPLLEPTLLAICQLGEVNTWVYWEHLLSYTPKLPSTLSIIKQGKGGQVCYYLGKIAPAID